jgi:glycosyltransferase involved in cell wall biosynthesis
VSVIIPAYKAAEFISETLDSVFAQTFRSFEVIVISDGSLNVDERAQVITPYRGKILYSKQENRGPAGVTQEFSMRGEYVTFLDSDDSWLPDYLAPQIKLFEGTSSLDAVYCDAVQFGAQAPARSEGVPTARFCRLTDLACCRAFDFSDTAPALLPQPQILQPQSECYPADTGSAQIRRSVWPNKRRYGCTSASNS